MPPFRLFDDKLPGEKQRILWTLKENLLLLNVISEMRVIKALCLNTKGAQACDSLYDNLSWKLRKLGCERTGQQIRGRWIILRRLYLKEHARQAGDDNATNPYLSRELYDTMTKIIGKEVHLTCLDKTYRFIEGVESSVKNINGDEPTTSSDKNDCVISPPPPPSGGTWNEEDFYPLEVCLVVRDEDISSMYREDCIYSVRKPTAKMVNLAQVKDESLGKNLYKS